MYRFLFQSKGGVLAKTVDYIQQLREENAHFIDVMSYLKHENDQLRETLHKAGIEAPPVIQLDFPIATDSIITVREPAISPDDISATTSGDAAAAVASILPTAASTSTSGGEADAKTSSAFTLSSGGGVIGLPKGSTRYVLVHTNKGVSLVQESPQNHEDDQSQQHESDGGEEHSGQD